MLHSLTICHIAVDMLHIVAICDIAVDMLHIVAICHIAVNMSNRSKIGPYKMKKIFLTNGAPYVCFVKSKTAHFETRLYFTNVFARMQGLNNKSEIPD